jgi:transcriptional regulator EpsA
MNRPLPTDIEGSGSFFDRLPHHGQRDLIAIFESALGIREHEDLLHWLDTDFQRFLPHQVLIAAWGDFSQGRITFEVVSPCPAAQTIELEDERSLPLLQDMFERWLSNQRMPLATPVNAKLLGLPADSAVQGSWRTLAEADIALAHGFKDQRGRHDCLYVLFGDSTLGDREASDAVSLLLPYLDLAQRQMQRVPGGQRPTGTPALVALRDTLVELEEPRLSRREVDIMDWVGKGKTNFEIGMILDISPLTVKNHMVRIFRKLDAINRAQAVARFKRTARLA